MSLSVYILPMYESISLSILKSFIVLIFQIFPLTRFSSDLCDIPVRSCILVIIDNPPCMFSVICYCYHASLQFWFNHLQNLILYFLLLFLPHHLVIRTASLFCPNDSVCVIFSLPRSPLFLLFWMFILILGIVFFQSAYFLCLFQWCKYTPL